MKTKSFFLFVVLLIVIPFIVPNAVINEIELSKCADCSVKKLVKIRTFEFWVFMEPLSLTKEIVYSDNDETTHKWDRPIASWISGSKTVEAKYRYYFLSAALFLLLYRFIIKKIIINKDFLTYSIRHIKAFRILIIFCGLLIMSYIFMNMITNILSELIPKNISISPVINLKGNVEDMTDIKKSKRRKGRSSKKSEESEGPLNIGGIDVEKMIENIDNRNKNIKDLDIFKDKN